MLDLIPYQKLENLSRDDRHIPLYQKVIKLGEESGEVFKAFLEYDNADNVSKSADVDKPVMAVLEECCDTINCAMDIINTLTDYDIELMGLTRQLFRDKLSKWEDKQNARQNTKV